MLPILFLLVIGNAYSGSFSDVPIAITNLDPLMPAQVFEQALRNSTTLTVVASNISVSDANAMIDSGQIAGFVFIPVNFSKTLLPFPLGVTPDMSNRINVTDDNTNIMISQALEGLVAQVLNETLHDSRVASWFTNTTHLPFRMSGLSIGKIDRYSTGFTFIDFLAPGILLMTVLFTSLFAAGMPIILDREVGYFDMLLSTPTRRSDLVLGFTLAGVTKVIAQATFVLVIAILLGIHMVLSVLSILYIYILATLLGLGFVGISIALSVKIELTAMQFVNGLINFPVFFLSGAFYPVESLPAWLKSVVFLNPMTYAVDGLRAVMIKGSSILAVMPDVIFVGVFALLTQILGNLALYLALSGRKIQIRHRKHTAVAPALAAQPPTGQQ
jgi:ABC-2 type transport system permease protein